MKVLTLKDFKYLIDNLFKNKSSLDKISESEEGVLLFIGLKDEVTHISTIYGIK